MFKLQRLEITGFKSFADYTEIVFTGNGITAVVGPNGCGKCVSGDTMITLSNGKEVEIRELVENSLKESFYKEQFDDGFLTRENPQDIEIISLNPNTLKLEPRRVSAFIKRETTPKLLLIKTLSGREIKATPYHPLFTLKNGKLKTLRADEIQKGVKIAVPRILKTTEKTINFSLQDCFDNFNCDDNVFLPFSDNLKNWSEKGKNHFGTIENWATKAEVSRSIIGGLRNRQSINVAELQKLSRVFENPLFENEIKSKGTGFLKIPQNFSPDLARFLGLLIAEGRNTYSNQVWFVNSDEAVNTEFERIAGEVFDVGVVQKQYKKGATDSFIFSKSLCKMLERFFNFSINSNSFEKEVPLQIFESDNKTKWSFFSGLFEGDAYICSRPQKSNGRLLNYIEYATASKKLAEQTVSVLLRLGIFAYLRPKQKYASNTTKKTIRTYYSVLIYGSKQLTEVARNLSFVGDKQKSLEKLRNIKISDNPNRDLVPTATELVREAVKLADVKVKPNRKSFPKIAAYTGRICEASRTGLNEVVAQIKQLSSNIQPAESVLEELSILANSDIFWDEIVSVEEIEPTENWVYDLSIDETHNFVAGNIIVHNSNVSESIAWVLGEQRAKALRGAEMKDVVFQGTKSRKPSGMAEVVLHLVRDEDSFFVSDENDLSDIDVALSDLDENAVDVDELEAAESNELVVEGETNGFQGEELENVQAAQVGSIQTVEKKIKPKRHWRPRAFALDFAPGEAISVTRRLYLSGESEYQLNGKNCRLRDIQDLFAGTGLSGAHYAIIEQGRIGQILSAKPSDRRNLIEEAAGISKFRTRQRAAETRLESAKSNLSRISDIVSEIDKQANALRRQASKTRRYKLLREEFRVLLRQLFAAEGKYLSDLVGELEAKLTEATAVERKLFSDVAEKDEAFREATGEARTAEENLSEIRQRHSENALERDRAAREHRYQTEQITNLNNRSAILKGEIDSTEKRLKLLKEEIARLSKEEKTESSEAEKAENALRETEAKHQTKIGELRKIETELEAIRRELLQHTTAVERFAGIERQLENNLERLKERAEGLKREKNRATETFAEHREKADNLAENIQNESAKLKTLHSEKQEILASAAEARGNVKQTEDALRKLRDEFSRKRNRLETLQELEEKRAVYAPQIQKLFAAQEKIGVKFAGILADKFETEERAEKAVESLFGSYLQSVLVETEADAHKTLAYLTANNIGRIAVLVVKRISDSKFQISNSKPKNRIAHLIGISDDFAEILTATFPREMAAELVENFDNATSENDNIFVSFEGDLLIGGKLFVGGKTNTNDKNSSLLAFKRELRELEKDANKLGIEIEKSQAETENARKVLSEREESIVDLQSVILKVERELHGLEVQEKSARQEIERAERHQKVVANETSRIETELAEIVKKQSEAKTNAEKAALAQKEANINLEKIAQKLNEARRDAESENVILNEKRTLAATSNERRRSAQTALRRVETEEKELLSRITRQNMELTETENTVKGLQNSIGQISERIASAQDEQEEEKDELAAATAYLKNSRETADAMSAELAELNKKSAEARNERAAFEIRQAETMTKLRAVNDNCSHELNVSLVELVENEMVEPNFDLNSARTQADDLREKLENFGAINMLALEELSETEERLLFLTSQRQDIIDGIAAAEAALKEIKERSRERFREAFHAINANFIEFFQELFGGGRGEMTLLEAEDLLEAGIEIAAQPPGKRLQNILLLSGGEKAMTAIALVMAIFKYRPAPFCLLDEVDAPLDDANVGRFVNKIAAMSEKTQFIVITHNKRTMEAARALYGVTMQEAGVSSVVSVKFE